MRTSWSRKLVGVLAASVFAFSMAFISHAEAQFQLPTSGQTIFYNGQLNSFWLVLTRDASDNNVRGIMFRNDAGARAVAYLLFGRPRVDGVVDILAYSNHDSVSFSPTTDWTGWIAPSGQYSLEAMFGTLSINKNGPGIGLNPADGAYFSGQWGVVNGTMQRLQWPFLNQNWDQELYAITDVDNDVYLFMLLWGNGTGIPVFEHTWGHRGPDGIVRGYSSPPTWLVGNLPGWTQVSIICSNGRWWLSGPSGAPGLSDINGVGLKITVDDPNLLNIFPTLGPVPQPFTCN